MRRRTVPVALRCPAERPIAEPQLSKEYPIQEIPPIEDRLPAHGFPDHRPVKRSIFRPFGGEEEGVRPVKRRIRVGPVVNLGDDLPGVGESERVVRAHRDPFLEQKLRDAQGRRPADVIGIWLEGKTQDGDHRVLDSSHGIKQKPGRAFALMLVSLVHSLQDGRGAAVAGGNRREGEHVLRKA